MKAESIMNTIVELERMVSNRIIQEDTEAIFSLLSSERDPIFSLEIIPYYALFVQSCQEYFGGERLSEEIALDIKNIRNHIKSYAVTFGRTKREIASIDQEQDIRFKSQIQFEFLKNWGIYWNLGIYWTDDRHIIGNTQQLAAFMNMKDLTDNEIDEKQFELAYQIGAFVANVRNTLAPNLILPVVERPISAIKIEKYCDVNTNEHNAIFVKHTSKELNLFYLNLLCNMNFVKHILKPLFVEENTWAFRIEYVVTYYTFQALKRLKNHCENNHDMLVDTKEIRKLEFTGRKLFQTRFRNCMMHYNLENQGVLLSDHIEKPFFGIIENCFEGENYQTYLMLLHEFSDKIIAYLEKQFGCDGFGLKQL